MKKTFFASLIISTNLLADVTTILPYAGKIEYSDNINESAKDNGKIVGVYVSKGNLNYLADFSYTKTDIKYKDSTVEDLKQNDYTLSFSKYNKNFMAKLGIHHIDTNEADLGNGNIFMAAVGGYKWKAKDKYSYGLESYYSIYADGHDDDDNLEKIDIFQLTPYFAFSKAININTRNNIGIKVNHIIANDFHTEKYTSYEIKDTLYYKKFYTELTAYGGEMKAGVKDNGSVAYNTKDLLKDGYGIKLGYYFKPNFSMSASYATNNFLENNKTVETSNNVYLLTLLYTF